MMQHRGRPAFLRKTVKPKHPQFNDVSPEWYVECVHPFEHPGVHRSAKGEAWVTMEATVIDRRG